MWYLIKEIQEVKPSLNRQFKKKWEFGERTSWEILKNCQM